MDYENHLKELRETYYKAYPRQRIDVAKQRIDNPESGSNLIITYVSAIEGFLRSLVVWNDTVTDRPSQEVYDKYKKYNVKDLYNQYLEQTQVSSEHIVSSEIYELVSFAVDYRNLLAHECTYLGQDKYPELIEACEHFLRGLCKHAGIEYS